MIRQPCTQCGRTAQPTLSTYFIDNSAILRRPGGSAFFGGSMDHGPAGRWIKLEAAASSPPAASTGPDWVNCSQPPVLGHTLFDSKYSLPLPVGLEEGGAGEVILARLGEGQTGRLSHWRREPCSRRRCPRTKWDPGEGRRAKCKATKPTPAYLNDLLLTTFCLNIF